MSDPGDPSTPQQRTLASAIQRGRPEVERVVFEPDAGLDYVLLLMPPDDEYDENYWLRFRPSGDAQRYLLGEIDLPEAGREFRLFAPDGEGTDE